MRYQMREKIFSIGDQFTIRDEDGRDLFMVRGRIFSIGDKLTLEDMDGNELLRIEQKLFSFGPTYNILRGDEEIARVSKHLFTLLHCRFTVDVPGPDDLEARGDLLDHEYSFERDGREVATVTSKFFSLSDTYSIEVADGEDDLLILASAIVIDRACHEGKNE